MKKMFILGMTVLILSLAFVGCDSDGDEGSSSGGEKSKFDGTWNNSAAAGGAVSTVIKGNTFTSSQGGKTVSKGSFTFTDTKVTFVLTQVDTGSGLAAQNPPLTLAIDYTMAADGRSFTLSGEVATTYHMAGTYTKK